MSWIKYILFAGFFTTAVLAGMQVAVAQQDPLYTQYMNNLQIINPGFAGSNETGSVMLVARNQWVSFDGAPTTRSLSFHSPVNAYNMGVGFSVLTDKIGPLTQTGFYFDYSYFLHLGEKYQMGLGLKGGFNFYRAALADLQTVSPDPIYSQDIFKNFLPNFGVGAFVFSDNTYFGLSIPKLVENVINRNDYSTEYISKEKIHYYLVAGKKFTTGGYTQIKAHSMLRVAPNAPVTFDVTAMFGLKEKFWVGGMYRLNDSYGLLTQFAIGKMLIGYSYDLSFSELNAFSSGTHEIMFSYNIDLFGQTKRKSD